MWLEAKLVAQMLAALKLLRRKGKSCVDRNRTVWEGAPGRLNGRGREAISNGERHMPRHRV